MVYISTQITKVVSMKYLFWLSWGTLFLLIINEKTDSFKFSEYITYIVTSLLAFLHLFNLKYCKFLDETNIDHAGFVPLC